MRKYILKTLLGVLILVVILIVFFAFKPLQFHLNKSIFIKAPEEIVQEYVSNLEHYSKWNEWRRFDQNFSDTLLINTEMVYSYSGLNIGTHSIRKKDSLNFNYLYNKQKANINWRLKQHTDSVKLYWSLDGETKGIQSKIQMYFADSLFNQPVRFSLKRLKHLVESKYEKIKPIYTLGNDTVFRRKSVYLEKLPILAQNEKEIQEEVQKKGLVLKKWTLKNKIEDSKLVLYTKDSSIYIGIQTLKSLYNTLFTTQKISRIVFNSEEYQGALKYAGPTWEFLNNVKNDKSGKQSLLIFGENWEFDFNKKSNFVFYKQKID